MTTPTNGSAEGCWSAGEEADREGQAREVQEGQGQRGKIKKWQGVREGSEPDDQGQDQAHGSWGFNKKGSWVAMRTIRKTVKANYEEVRQGEGRQASAARQASQACRRENRPAARATHLLAAPDQTTTTNQQARCPHSGPLVFDCDAWALSRTPADGTGTDVLHSQEIGSAIL